MDGVGVVIFYRAECTCVDAVTETISGGRVMSKSKYKQGERINTISEFDACECLWYKWNGKTTHRSVLMSLQYRTLLETIIAGRLFRAERIEE